MSLGLAITEYVKQLHSMTAVCERPRPDGSKCLQCYERANVIRSLEYILQTEEPRAYEALMAVTEETVHRKWTTTELNRGPIQAPPDQKLSVKELTSLANAAANLIKPLALADRDALGERKKKAKETVTKTPWWRHPNELDSDYSKMRAQVTSDLV